MIESTNSTITENFILEEIHKLQVYMEDLRYCENYRQENDRIAQSNFNTLNKRIQQLEEENKILREDNDVLMKHALKITTTLVNAINESKETFQHHKNLIDILEKSFSKSKI